MNRFYILYYVAAACTISAGIIHLYLGPNFLRFNPNGAILFFAGGAAQIFWGFPLVRRMGKAWYLGGIGGTLILVAIWVTTRFEGNPLTGRGLGINSMSILAESLEISFIGLCAAILIVQSRMKRLDEKTATEHR